MNIYSTSNERYTYTVKEHARRDRHTLRHEPPYYTVTKAVNEPYGEMLRMYDGGYDENDAIGLADYLAESEGV